MAGDIKVRERLIVLPPAQSVDAAAARVAQAQGVVIHRYGSRVLIAALQSGASTAVEDNIPGAEVTREPQSLPHDTLADLDPNERLGLEALSLRQTGKYLEAKATRPHNGEDWDSGAAETPACRDLGATRAEAQALLAQAPTSSRLTGKIAVGIIIVQGPTKGIKLTKAERTKVIAEVQNGLGWLASQSPQGVSWHYDIHVVNLTVKPGPTDASSSAKEKLWRDPAMAKLGYGSGLDGVRDYVEHIRSTLNTNWGYCAFFTKYPLGHFAYASIGGPRLVMAYGNDGWGPDNIDRVFAHETGHIFGAPDEYASSNCNCGGSWGYYGKPNKNCASCAPGGGVPCIMKSNDWEMCVHTPYHLGFPLVSQRYSGVWRGGTDSYYLWVNASWNSFVKKWQALAKRNLRLIDLEISGIGSKLRYNGVWRSGSGGYYLWVNASWNSFRAKWQELAKKNLRLVDIEVRVIGGKLRYSGVWLPGKDSYYLWVNASWSSFVKKWQELGKKNLRLVDFKSVRVGSSTRYFGVWRHGTGGYYLWVNATWKSFYAKWKDLGKKNLRLVDLEVTNYGGKRRYSGVWLPGKDAYYLWVNADWQHFRAKWEELAKKKLRLIDLEITAPGDPAGSTIPEQAGGEPVSEFGGAADGPDVGVEEDESKKGFGDGELDGGGSDSADDGFGGGELGDDGSSDSGDELDDGLGGGEFDSSSDAGDDDGDGGGSIGGEADDDDNEEGFGSGELAASADEPEDDSEDEDGYGGGSS